MENMSSSDKADEEVLTLPFPDRVLNVYRQLSEAEDPNDRYMLSRELAEIFAETHDPTDPNLTDIYHQYFEEFDHAKLAYDQAALKVARLASQVIEQYLVHKGLSPEDLGDPLPDRNAN